MKRKNPAERDEIFIYILTDIETLSVPIVIISMKAR